MFLPDWVIIAPVQRIACKKTHCTLGLKMHRKSSLTVNFLVLRKLIAVSMGARRNFSRGEQSHRHFKKSTRFRRAAQKIDHFFGVPKAQTKIFAFFCDVLDYNIGYLVRAPKPRATILGYFAGRQHMTSLFQIPGGGKCPPAPPCGRPWLLAGTYL